MLSRRRPALFGALLALVLSFLAAAPPAGAQGTDTVGLWFDPAYTENDGQGMAFPYYGEVYLVLHQPAAQALGGWECQVATEGPVTVLGWQLQGNAVNFDTAPSFIVGLGSPLPAVPDVLLATAPFVIGAPAPVTFRLLPVFHASIPGSMAYITFADPETLLPMGTATGEPEVAWYNRELPVCTVEPAALDFGQRPVGVESLRVVTVRNDGGGGMAVDPVLVSGDAGFRIVSGAGAVLLEHGEELTITVGFTPTGEIACADELLVGGDCVAVPLAGVGRPPVVLGYVLPNPVAFGEVTATRTLQRVVAVVNGGELPLDVVVAPQAGCDAFTFPGGTTFTVPVGQHVPLVVEFTPPAAGAYACEVPLHPAIPPLQLTGTGLAPVVAWTVTPTSLDFGTLGLGGPAVTRAAYVRNVGDLPTALDIGLVDPDGVFTVTGPADPQPLVAPGESVIVSVVFAPTLVGTYGGTLVLGGGAADVPLTAVAEEPLPGCELGAGTIDYGRVPVGAQTVRSVQVHNSGNVDLNLAPATSCPDFRIQDTPPAIPPGGSDWLTVAFSPVTLGVVQCLLHLGPEACADISLVGEGITGGGALGENLAGISFNPDFLQDEIHAPPLTPVHGYLVMTSTAYGNGVWGWEMKITYDPGVLLLGTYPRGQAINFLTAPEFLVGLASPLPEAPLIVLAEFDLFVLDDLPHYLGLEPVSVASIPGQMAWAYNENYDLAVTLPVSGEPIVAVINPDIIVGVQVPQPTAAAAGRRLELRWRVSGGEGDGCHVYRAVGDEESRLTATPVRPSGGSYLYVDDLAGLAPGSQVAYSYALLRGDVEIARSPTLAVEVPGTAVLASRLLPNRPNPFNPETELHYELARGGHVRLAVFDVSGRRIAVLEDGVREAGAHQVVWRGRDDAGRGVPSGAYYVQLETTTGRDTRKVMLLK